MSLECVHERSIERRGAWGVGVLRHLVIHSSQLTEMENEWMENRRSADKVMTDPSVFISQGCLSLQLAI